MFRFLSKATMYDEFDKWLWSICPLMYLSKQIQIVLRQNNQIYRNEKLTLQQKIDNVGKSFENQFNIYLRNSQGKK